AWMRSNQQRQIHVQAELNFEPPTLKTSRQLSTAERIIHHPLPHLHDLFFSVIAILTLKQAHLGLVRQAHLRAKTMAQASHSPENEGHFAYAQAIPHGKGANQAFATRLASFFERSSAARTRTSFVPKAE